VAEWKLTDEKINELQVDSINRLIQRCKAAHFVNVQVRINGRFEIFEADWLKHLTPISAQETRVDDGRCICLAGVSDIPEHDEDCPRRQAKAPICSCGTPYGKYCPIHPGDK
jgi:hypothetical protein